MKSIIYKIRNRQNKLAKNRIDIKFLVIFFITLVFFIFTYKTILLQEEKVVDYIPQIKEVAVVQKTNKKESVSKTKQNNVVVKKEEEVEKGPESKSVYVYDISNNKVIYSFNENFILPLASMTKIMTAIIALDELGPSTIIEIPEESLETLGDSGLVAGEKWKVGELVKFMLVMSSNDVAAALKIMAEKNGKNFVSLMNERALKLDLKDTFFINETGLDATEKTGGSYGSAHDIAVLMQYANENYKQYFEPTRFPEYNLSSEDGVIHHLKNTNTEIGSIKNMLASKTGYTTLAGGNLVFIFDADVDHEVVVSIFGSTKGGRFADAKKYSDLAIENIQK